VAPFGKDLTWRCLTNGSNPCEETTPVPPKSPQNMLKEHYTFIIAVIVIVPFMIFFGVVLIVFKDMILSESS